MSGQAAISINEHQWSASIASSYAELTTGLSGVTSLPAGTGMLFVLPSKQAVSVDTTGMNFPLDIVFISDNIVIDVATNIEPGYQVTEETPCDVFLEINAGEAAEVGAGDTVTIAIIQGPGFDWRSIISFAIPVAALGFVCAMAGGIARLMGGSSSSPKLLPKTMKTFKSGEIVLYKGERVRVSEQIGDRVNIFIPSRQELVWVKPEMLKRTEDTATKGKI